MNNYLSPRIPENQKDHDMTYVDFENPYHDLCGLFLEKYSDSNVAEKNILILVEEKK
jgi:hypothetical protein